MPSSPKDIERRQRNQERHFRRRCRERFKLRVSTERYKKFMALVTEQGEGTVFLEHQPPNRTVWRIVAGGKAMHVVYDHFTECLVTCLWVDGDERAQKRRRQRTEDRTQKRRRLSRSGRLRTSRKPLTDGTDHD